MRGDDPQSDLQHLRPSSEPENERLLQEASASQDAEAPAVCPGPHDPAPTCTADPPTLPQSPAKWLRKRFSVAGLDPSPELLAVSLGYFVQGNRSQMVYLAEQYFLKDTLLLSPAQAEVLLGIAGMPWVIKPLYGLCTDTFPLFGYRRRSYLVACGLAGSLAFLCLGGLAHTLVPSLLLIGVSELAIAFSDVVIDGVVVEQSRGEPQATAGALQSVCWGSQATGSMLSAYAGGRLIGWWGPRPVFFLMSLMTLLVSLTGLFIREQRCSARGTAPAAPALHHHPSGDVSEQLDMRDNRSGLYGKDMVVTDHARGGHAPGDPDISTKVLPVARHRAPSTSTVQPSSYEGSVGVDDHAKAAAPPQTSALQHQTSVEAPADVLHVREQLKLVWTALRMPAIMMPAIFIFLWQGSPSVASAMFYFYTERLKFAPEFVGSVRVLEGAGQLAGVWLFNRFLRSRPMRPLLAGLCLAGGVVSLTQLVLVTGLNRKLGLNDKLFALTDTTVVAAMVRVALMPMFVLAARVCPPGIEACFFSFLMSLSNAGQGLATLLGSALTQVLGVTATNFDHLPLLVFICSLLGLLPLAMLWLVPPDAQSDMPENAEP